MAVVKGLGGYLGDALHRSGHAVSNGVVTVKELHKAVILYAAGVVLGHPYLLADYPLLLLNALLRKIRYGDEFQKRFKILLKTGGAGKMVGSHIRGGKGVGRGAVFREDA